jgi:hypothetical protein
LYVKGGAVVFDVGAELSKTDGVFINVVVLVTLTPGAPRAGATVVDGIASPSVIGDEARELWIKAIKSQTRRRILSFERRCETSSE